MYNGWYWPPPLWSDEIQASDALASQMTHLAAVQGSVPLRHLETAATHAPPTHSLPEAQTCPHEPQFASSVSSAASQPLAYCPSQLAKLEEQAATMHEPEEQPGVPLAMEEQAAPQLPQLETLVWVLISQPSVAIVLQSLYPAEQT